MTAPDLKGLFITFEGPEGCGKSTHVKQLQAALKKRGIPVTVTREPGSTKIGKDIRKVLMGAENAVDPMAELFLFAADRAQDVSEVIIPALEKGHAVLCDRFTDSTLAYQIGGRRLLEDLVRYVNNVSAKGLVPDLTFLLDVPVDLGLSRSLSVQAAASKSVDRFSREALTFHERLRAYYHELANNQPDRFRVISTEAPQEEVHKKIVQETFAAWEKRVGQPA